MSFITKIVFWFNVGKSKRFLRKKHGIVFKAPGEKPAAMDKIPQCGKKPDPRHFQYIGNGPSATGANAGWAMSGNLYFRCICCGYMMKAITKKNERCDCGNLYKDCDAGRFGSNFGDENIEVYKLI